MGIGASIFLIAVGAILTFALNYQVGFLDFDVVGWVLMIAGVVGLIFTTLIWGPRHRRITRDTTDIDDTYRRYETGEPVEYRRYEERSDRIPRDRY